jgi:hypothetical protein
MTYDPDARVPRPVRRLAGVLGALALGVFAVAVAIGTWNLVNEAADEVLGTPPPVAAAGSPSPRPSTAGSPGASVDPSASPDPAPSVDPSASIDPLPSGAPASPSAEPEPTPTPKPERRPVDLVIESKPARVFASEAKDTWCAAAAVQIALNVNGPRGRADTSTAFQTRVRELQVAMTTRKDSRNGGAGPLGMIGSLEALGKVDYKLKVYPTRDEAVRGAAEAITRTGHAAILLAWRGAHAWVMTGYRADADPTIFRNVRMKGAYIVDPWYPRVSSIWGPSDKPGVFQDRAEMKRNFLPWRRPEGRYPSRDGRFLVLVPTN